MKKTICYFLVTVMAFSMCFGCGDSKTKSKVETTSSIEETTETSLDLEETADGETSSQEQSTTEEVTTTVTPTTTVKETTTKKQETTTTQHSHNYSKTTYNPTCSEQGYSVYVCACGDSYESDYMKAKGHTIVVDKEIAATTTSTGLTEGSHCSVCGMILTAQQTIPMIELTPAEKTSVTIVGVGNTYNYYSVGQIRSSTYVHSADYKITTYGEMVVIDVTVIIELVYPENISRLCGVGFELYDSDGVCVDTDSNCVTAESGTKYSKSISFKMVEPGEYTVKLCDYD